jgi:hypothetical protein
MAEGYLSADDLLAGGTVLHDVEVPAGLLGRPETGAVPAKVRLRPLTVRDVQRVSKAARDGDALLSILMLKESVVEPTLSFEQVQGLPSGLARFLLREVNRVSGLWTDDGALADAAQAPLARACFVLAREFGWSPQDVGELTVGQVMLYLEMLREGREADGK